MHRFNSFVLLLVFSLLFYVLPVQADSDSIQITSASVICGTLTGFWGASYNITANYTANGQRIIDEYMDISGGGRIDTYYHIGAGTSTLSNSEYEYGNVLPGLPYKVDLVMELYAATTIDYVNGRNVINGPLVARSTASAVCTKEGPTEVIISVGVGGAGGAGKPFDPGDGRIKPDPAAPIAVYCRDYGIDVYRINPDSSGVLVFTATNEEIDAVGASPVVNTLIDFYEDIRLYRLTTGEFQINDGPNAEGKEYILIWAECGKHKSA